MFLYPSDSPSDFSFIVYFVLLFDLADELTKVHLSPPVLNMIYDDLYYLTWAFPLNFVAIFLLIDVKPKPRLPAAIDCHMR